MKLMLILLAVLALVVLLTRSAAPRGPAGAAPSGGLATSLTILLLRIARALLAVMTLLTVLVAFKFMLVLGGSARAGGSLQDAWVALGLLAGIGLLLYFLFWTAARLRQRINRLHLSRPHARAPLLAGRWSW